MEVIQNTYDKIYIWTIVYDTYVKIYNINLPPVYVPIPDNIPDNCSSDSDSSSDSDNSSSDSSLDMPDICVVS